MFQYELHLHTAESSRCGNSPAAEMVQAYKDKGYTGLCVTDHFVNGNSFARDITTGWKDRMDCYLEGYHAALEAGKRLGIDVFLGWEFSYLGNNAEDYLTLGLDEDFLYHKIIDCDQWDIQDYARAVHEAGGILIHAHPYRQAWYIHSGHIERPGVADAIEVYNGGNPIDSDYDDLALAYAKEHGCLMTGGSDTHHVLTTGISGVAFDTRPRDSRELCQLILAGKAQVIRNPKTVVA
ncbi:MAG: PHP domain-containing protein [Clostridia bacterium]|nr:PHP domain-containing protein [Clostridia bacterium]